jgi:hypothetical protein
MFVGQRMPGACDQVTKTVGDLLGVFGALHESAS